MDPVVFIGLVLFLGCSALAVQHSRRTHWEAAADELGLALSVWGLALDGRIGTYEVTVVRSSAPSRLTFNVHSQTLPRELRLAHASGLPGWYSKLRAGGEDLRTGDHDFDDAVLVIGSSAEALARLDQDTRDQLRRALDADAVTVKDQDIRRTIATSLWNIEDIVPVVRSLVGIADALQLDGEVADALAANAQLDREPEVRVRNLRQLQRSTAEATAVTASRIACRDSDPRVRLQGALHLGDEGVALVKELVADAEAPADVRIHGLRHLARHHPSDEVMALVESYVSSEPYRLRLAAVEACGRCRVASALPELRRLIDRADEEMAVAIAEAVARIGGSSAEGDLSRLLEHQSMDVRRAAIRGLGKHGTVASVPRLKQASTGTVAKSSLKNECAEAIATIQSRAEGASAGQLAISRSDHPEGSLGLVEPDIAGALAITDDE